MTELFIKLNVRSIGVLNPWNFAGGPVILFAYSQADSTSFPSELPLDQGLCEKK